METKPLRTDREIWGFIKRTYGSYEQYRKVESGNYREKLDRELVGFEVASELRKRDGDAERLIKERPDLYQEYREKAAIKIELRQADTVR